MLQYLLFGLFLGWGAAIPIGPINLEMTRRNLRYGTPAGVALGMGAGLADLTFLVLLSFGALQILVHPLIIKIVGLLGALILAWFGYSALRADPKKVKAIHDNSAKRSFGRNLIEGYLLTLINPFTLMFWSSISATIAIRAHHAQSHYSIIYTGIGIVLGTWSWSTSLNIFLHFTRHRLSDRAMHILNLIGGLILLGFAAFSLWHVFAESF